MIKTFVFVFFYAFCYCSRISVLSNFLYYLEEEMSSSKEAHFNEQLYICRHLLGSMINDRMLNTFLKLSGRAVSYEVFQGLQKLYELRKASINHLNSRNFRKQMYDSSFPSIVLDIFFSRLQPIKETLMTEMFWNITQHYFILCAVNTGNASHIPLNNGFDDRFPLKVEPKFKNIQLRETLWSEVQKLKSEPAFEITKKNYRFILKNIEYNQETIPPNHQSFLPSVLIEAVKLLFIEDLINDLSLISLDRSLLVKDLDLVATLHQQLSKAVLDLGAQLSFQTIPYGPVISFSIKEVIPLANQPEVLLNPISFIAIFLVQSDPNLPVMSNFGTSTDCIRIFISDNAEVAFVLLVFDEISSLVNSSQSIKISEMSSLLQGLTRKFGNCTLRELASMVAL
jgi:hypothetical protein